MKITKERFWELIHAKFGYDESDGTTCDCEHCQVMHIIERNQEDAKKYRKVKNIKGIDDTIRQRILILNGVDFSIKKIMINQEIVERLKKRLEYPFEPENGNFQEELKKILGEEK